MAQSLLSVVVLPRTEIYHSELIASRDGASLLGRFKSNISPPYALVVHRFLKIGGFAKTSAEMRYLVTF